MRMKYIRLQNDQLLIFTAGLTHSDVFRNADFVESAGECEVGIQDGKFQVWAGGHSVSLGKKSDPTDALLIQRMFERSTC